MKNKINLYALLIIFTATFPYTANAQWNQAVKAVKAVGKLVLTEAMGTVVQKEMEKAFYASETNAINTEGRSQANYGNNYRNPIEVTVTNDINALTYFWVTIDGNYWYPYVLGPGQYFYVQSGGMGKIGIFNGYKVDVLVQGGSYYSSQFF